jgi:protein tyrosine phosphatase (PTP) superfamily phosphohydrolase (DUF442 family)
MVGCSEQSSSRPATTGQTSTQEAQRIDAPHLPNALKLHDKVISGGQPEGDEAFRELQALGVRTIISVDGAKPDVELARKFGMRYVHLPHGYDGIPEGRVKELAKAVRDLDGPIYIHCHHGKHRSPTAAAVACVATGLIQSESAVPFLQAAGTSENYTGLYRSASEAKRLEAGALDGLKVEFREIAELPAIAEAMVAIEHTHDRLKAVAKAGWQADPKHPDVEPAHEALIIQEHFTELLRTPEVKKRSQRFLDLARECESASRVLETTLRGWKPVSSTAKPPDAIEKSFVRLTANCAACHKEFRDVPLGDKLKD